MKILCGITKSNFGGAQRYVFDLAVAASECGHEVAVLCGGEGVLVDKLRAENIQVFSLPTLGRDISTLEDMRSFFYILKILEDYKPDVFHLNSSKMGGIGGLAGRIMGVPKIIFTSHGWAFNERRSYLQKLVIKFLHWLTILLSHKTICVSEKTKRDVSRQLLIQDKKLIVIHNGIEAFNLLPREESRQSLVPDIAPETLLVGALSELHHVKGLDVLLQAWEKFIKGRDAKLVILGSGDEKENLENMAQQLDIYDSVIFKGFVLDARIYLTALDIFVLPSRSENMPYALLEAGLTGRPVIASSVGGIPEVIESSISGALVRPEDPEALFSSLVLFHDNPRMRDRLGEGLKKTVEEKFSKEKMVRDTLSIYE
jgi:glycosyltransferase involved in cell wall biosynthesis